MGYATAQGLSGIRRYAYPQKSGRGYGPPQGREGKWTPRRFGSSLAAWYSADYGCYTDAACLFASAPSQSLSRTSPEASIRGTTGTPFWRAGWIKRNATGTYATLGNCYGDTANCGWRAIIWGSDDLFRLSVGDGSTVVSAQHSTVVGTSWAFFYCDWDGSNINLSVNGGAKESTACAAFTHDPAATYFIGNAYPSGLHTDGSIARVCGGNGTLSGSQIAALYNSGAGLFYADFPADIAALTGFAFNLCEASSTRVESVGGLDLTAVNSPTVAAGPGEGLCVNNSPCKRRNDRSGNGRHQSWGTAASQPIWMANVKNGRPALLYTTGVTRGLSATFAQAQPLAVFAAAKHATGVAGNQIIVYGNAGSPAVYLRGVGPTWGYFAGTEAGAGTPDASWHTHSAVFNGASSLRRLDGSQIDASDVGSAGYMTYTSGDVDTGSQSWDGYLAEDFLLGRLPTAAELTAADAYLAGRWT